MRPPTLSVRDGSPPSGSPAYWMLLAAAFLLPRLALWLLSTGAAYDLHSYSLVEAALRAGQPLYRTPELAGRYPYPPAWAWTLEPLGRLARAGILSFPRAVKLPGLLAEAGIVWLLLRWEEGGRLLEARARRAAALAYALSPVSWMVTAGHGQFDAVVLFFVLAAARAWGRPGGRAGLAAGAWMGAALCFKQWPLFLLPFFFALRPRGTGAGEWGGLKPCFAFLAAALGLPLLCLAPYALAEGPAAVWGHLDYAGVAAVGLEVFTRSRLLGISQATVFGVGAAQARILLTSGLLAAFWTLSWLRAPRAGESAPLARALGGGLLACLILAPGVSPQYLIWPLPFLALARPRLAWAHSLACGAFLLATYLWFLPAVLLSGTHGPLLPVARMDLSWPLANLGLWLVLCAEWALLERGTGPARPLKG